MATWIRRVLARSTAWKPADVTFCEGCAEVCDAACRADALRRSEQLSLLAHAPMR